jgi:hypothetical protein
VVTVSSVNAIGVLRGVVASNDPAIDDHGDMSQSSRRDLSPKSVSATLRLAIAP